MAPKREQLKKIMRKTRDLTMIGNLYMPAEYREEGSLEISEKAVDSPKLNPGGLRLRRGLSSQLIWGWLMKNKGVTLDDLVSERVGSEQYREAAAEVVKHLQVQKKGPTFELPEEEQDPKTWGANMAVFCAAKCKEYLAAHLETAAEDPSAPQLELADPKKLAVIYSMFNIGQEDSQSWPEEYTGAAIQKMEHPEQPVDFSENNKKLLKEYVTKEQDAGNVYPGAESTVQNLLEAEQKNLDLMFSEGNPPAYIPGKMEAYVSKWYTLLCVAGYQKEIAAKNTDVTKLSESDYCEKVTIQSSILPALLAKEKEKEDLQPYSPAWLIKNDTKLMQLEKHVSQEDFEEYTWKSEQMAYAHAKMEAMEAFSGKFDPKGEDFQEQYSVQTVIRPVLTDKEAFLSQFGKGTRFSDLEFFDADGKGISLGRTLAQDSGACLFVRNMKTKSFEAFFTGENGSLRPAAPEDRLPDGRTVGTARDIAYPMAISESPADVSDAKKMHDITLELKEQLKALKENEHWFIRGSEAYRNMKTQLRAAIEAGEKGDSFADFHEKLRDLTKLSAAYCEKKEKEKDKSNLAKRRLAGVSQMTQKIGGLTEELTEKRLGNEEEKFYGSYVGRLNRDLQDKLKENKFVINDLLTKVKIAKKIFSETGLCSAQNTDLLTRYFLLRDDLRHGDGALLDSALDLGPAKACADAGYKNSIDLDHRPDPKQIPGYVNEGDWTEKDDEAQLEWAFAKYQMKKKLGGKSEQFFEKSGEMNEAEKEAARFLTDACHTEKVKAAAEGREAVHTFGFEEMKIYKAVKSEVARLTFLKEKMLENDQKMISAEKRDGVIVVTAAQMKRRDEISENFNRKIDSLLQIPAVEKVMNQVKTARETIALKKQAEADAKRQAAMTKQTLQAGKKEEKKEKEEVKNLK